MNAARLARAVAAMLAAASTPGAAAAAQQTVRIPAGTYRPLYSTGAATAVGAFTIDRDPVTREQFLRWRGGGRPAAADARRPMAGVTWGEAGAYCKARGGRLPTLAEWEYVAAASQSKKNAAGDPEFIQHLISLYASRAINPMVVDRAEVNALGVRGMHDLVWEWVADPNARVAALYHAEMKHEHRHGEAEHDMSCAGAAIGAADPRDYPAFLRGALRSGLTEQSRLPLLGFRCVM